MVAYVVGLAVGAVAGAALWALLGATSMRYTDFRAAIGTGTLMLVFVLAVVTGSFYL